MRVQDNSRLVWLSVLRGLCILLVVMRHVQLVDLQTGMNHEVCSLLSMPFDPVRMPLFIFTSGGLLYLSRIRKQWTVPRLYVDKAQRILLPFLFFVTVYYVMKWAMAGVVKTPVELSVIDFLESFILFEGHASAPLWFLATLSVLMLMYPLFCWLLRRHWTAAAFLLFSIAIYFFDFSTLSANNYFYLLKLNKYLVFFYSGIVFFYYKLYRFTGSWPFFIASTVIYSTLYHFDVPVASSLAGIMMLMSLCQLVACHYEHLFGTFRDYIYQIYLLSFFFQGFVELVLWRTLFYNEHLFWLFYVLNVVAGLYGPVLVVRIVERCPLRIVRLCFGLNS